MPEPRIGLAHSGYIRGFLEKHFAAIDYIEMPYELLQHDAKVRTIASIKPLILHCASLSIAGTVPPTPDTLTNVAYWLSQTQSPWLGEHLAFVTTDRMEAGPIAEAYAAGEPYNIGYTVHPSTNDEVLDLVLERIDRYASFFKVPLLLENAPVYFQTPGSTMSQVQFIGRLCENSNVGLLLDLAHLYISSQNMGTDPTHDLLQLPLDRVVEVHISGVDINGGTAWDDHTNATLDVILDLLAVTIANGPVQAITLEYNWSMRFSQAQLLREIERVRDVLFHATRVIP